MWGRAGRISRSLLQPLDLSIPRGVRGRGHQCAGRPLPCVNDVKCGNKADGEPHFDPDRLRHIGHELGARFELLAGNDIRQPALRLLIRQCKAPALKNTSRSSDPNLPDFATDVISFTTSLLAGDLCWRLEFGRRPIR